MERASHRGSGIRDANLRMSGLLGLSGTTEYLLWSINILMHKENETKYKHFLEHYIKNNSKIK